MTHYEAGFDPADMSGVAVSPDPVRTWKHKLLNQWRQLGGCVCAGIVTQGSVHSVCVVFAVASGAGGSAVTRALSPIFTGQVFGFSATQVFQYAAAPLLALPIAYGIDRWRGAKDLAWKKLGITALTCALAAPALGALFPHDHSLHSEADLAIARAFYQKLSPEDQAEYRRLAEQNNKSIEVMTLELQPQICTTTPSPRGQNTGLQLR